MLGYIIKREIQNILYGQVFQISFLLIIIVFSVGTIAFLKSNEERINKYSKQQNELTETLKSLAGSNISEFAVFKQRYVLKSRPTGFISDCKEKYFPYTFIHSAYNVFGFDRESDSANPFLGKFQEMNWSFVVSIILSFMVFLLAFDSVSGEKESGTLSLALSNSVSRGTLLFGKYVCIIISTLLALIVGIVLSLLIIILFHAVSISGADILVIAGFLFISIVFIGLIAAFAILSSVLPRNSNISLLISLTLWMLFITVIPNSSVFWAKKLFSIEHADAIGIKISTTLDDINRNAPEGSWAYSSGNPFLPQHKLRAANQTNLMNAEMIINNAYYMDMFRQFERTRAMTMLSPVSLFEYMVEAVAGGGYVRFKTVWEDLHIFQNQFLIFFKEKDANDADSPHWYNPYESISTTAKPVGFEEVPIFSEKPASINIRIMQLSTYLLASVLYALIIYFAAFAIFQRYDVR